MVINRNKFSQNNIFGNENQVTASIFKDVVDSSPLAIYIAEGIKQKAVYINPRFTQLFGYTLNEVPTADHWFPLAYPDPIYRKSLVKEWKRRVKLSYKTGDQMVPMQAVATCKNGSKKEILWKFSIVGNKNISYGLDLTENIKAQEKIIASERKFRTIFEYSPINTILLDLSGNIISVNNASVKMGGFNHKSEILGKNIMDFVDKRYKIIVKNKWKMY